MSEQPNGPRPEEAAVTTRPPAHRRLGEQGLPAAVPTFDDHLRLDEETSSRLSSSRMARSQQWATWSMAEGTGKLPIGHWRKAHAPALDDGQIVRTVLEQGLVDCLMTPAKNEACA